jgi:glucosamine--fructose-6-phosphate aminotransferase (isomerizing)
MPYHEQGRDKELTSELRGMPRYIGKVLDRAPEVEAATDMLVARRDVFYLAAISTIRRCMEGALKLKEISYIHC